MEFLIQDHSSWWELVLYASSSYLSHVNPLYLCFQILHGIVHIIEESLTRFTTFKVTVISRKYFVEIKHENSY